MSDDTCGVTLVYEGPGSEHPCVLDRDHEGAHRDDDGDRWIIRFPGNETPEVSVKTCQALWAPNPKEAYECMRLDGHGGFHLDDQLNMMWRSSWDGGREQPIGDARHSADTGGDPWIIRFPSNETPKLSAEYVHGALDGLKARVEALEQAAHPVSAPRTCTATMEVAGTGYDCTRSQGHTGPHWDSDPGQLMWSVNL